MSTLSRSLWFWFCLFPGVTLGQALPPAVADIIKRAGVPESSVSVVVREVGTGRTLLQHNAMRPLNPASVMKLVTTGAALDLLGPAFTYKTDFHITGTVVSGILEGDLHIRGGGDPKLTYERLWAALKQLRERGVRDIRGDIVLDRSYFAPVEHDPARFDGKPRRAYNVGPDALLLNFKAVTLRFIPDEEGVRVIADPPIATLDIVSRLKRVKNGGCGDWQERLKLDVQEVDLLATFFIEGNYAESCGEKAWVVSIFDHERFAGVLLRWLWSEAGGKLFGKVREGPLPATARRILQLESPPLAELVRDINKYSNNVMARQVFLSLSAERDQAPGSVPRSALIIRNWLATQEIEAPELVIENGSGLSRVDRLSASSTAALLEAVWRRGTMPELTSSLSLVGQDGTFKKRSLANGMAAHLKSGTLNDVRATAGYVLDGKGRRWIVVFYLNHGNAPAAQGAQEALLSWLAERP